MTGVDIAGLIVDISFIVTYCMLVFFQIFLPCFMESGY